MAFHSQAPEMSIIAATATNFGFINTNDLLKGTEYIKTNSKTVY